MTSLTSPVLELKTFKACISQVARLILALTINHAIILDIEED